MPDVEVPENEGMNFTARDLRPYYKGNAKDLVQKELLPHQQYQMGLVPRHVRRAAMEGAISGAGSLLVGAGMEAAGEAANTASRVISAPLRPDRLVNQTQNVTDFLEAAGKEGITQEQAEEALSGAGRSFGRLTHMLSNAVAPVTDTYREWKHPSSRAAETAAKRLAKARRKRDRRSEDGLSLYSRFVRPFRENAEISRRVREQMEKKGPIQLDVPEKN